MYRALLAGCALVLLLGCNNKPAPGPTTANAGNPAASPAPVSQPALEAQADNTSQVSRKLREIAGSDAKHCGAVASMAHDEIRQASDCAMDSAKNKKAFTVSYAMPGLMIGVAENPAGKLFTVQSQEENGHEIAPKVEPCPAALRLAQSGRVTCFQQGSMGVIPGSGNPHGQASPHGGLGAPTPGAPNPHQPPTGPESSH